MTREESEKYIKSKMCSDCGVHLGGGKCLDNCNVIEAIKALEQEPSKDMEEIEEVINCDTDAEIKLKMISNIVHSKPHYFKTSRENKIIDEHYWKGFSNGIRTAEWRATKQEPAYCDRNICIKNEYNGVGCDECEVTKSQEPCEDAISRKSLKHKLQEHHDFFVNAYGGFSNLPQNDKSRVDEITNCIAMVVNEPSVKPQLCEDVISKQAVNILVDELARAISDERCCMSRGRSTATIMQDILDLPSVKPQKSCDIPDTNVGKMSENPTGSKDVIWYSKRNYSEIVVEPQERSEE